jgi:hypothetical protein
VVHSSCWTCIPPAAQAPTMEQDLPSFLPAVFVSLMFLSWHFPVALCLTTGLMTHVTDEGLIITLHFPGFNLSGTSVCPESWVNFPVDTQRQRAFCTKCAFWWSGKRLG